MQVGAPVAVEKPGPRKTPGVHRRNGAHQWFDGAALEDGRALGSGENPDLAAALDHRACPVCKSWMFTRIAMLPDMVNLRAAMLDRDEWVTPFVETCRAEAQPGVVTGARHAFDGFPDAAAWPGLMAAYAREGARP